MYMRRYCLLLLLGLHASVQAQEECDGKTPPPAISPCTANHDIVIVLDNSVDDVDGGGAARSALLTAIVGAYKLGESPTGPRFALVQFDNEALVVSNFTDHVGKLTTAIADRPAASATATTTSGGTCTYCGLETAQALLSASTRADARKVIILIIDGIAVRLRAAARASQAFVDALT